MDEHPVPPIDCDETELVLEHDPQPAAEAVSSAGPADPIEAALDAESPILDQPIEYVSVIRATRTWIQYGIFGFAVLCIVIGAVEAMFGR